MIELGCKLMIDELVSVTVKPPRTELNNILDVLFTVNFTYEILYINDSTKLSKNEQEIELVCSHPIGHGFGFTMVKQKKELEFGKFPMAPKPSSAR